MHSVHVCDVILAGVALGQAAARRGAQVGSTKWRHGVEGRRDVAREDGEADELAVQGHDAHDALLRTWVVLLP
jgi:hypothetical protein